MNYITDDGAALKAAVEDACSGFRVRDWMLVTEDREFTADDDEETLWVTNQHFDFNLSLRSPAGLSCVTRGIKDAGGPEDTPACEFSPLIDPP